MNLLKKILVGIALVTLVIAPFGGSFAYASNHTLQQDGLADSTGVPLVHLSNAAGCDIWSFRILQCSVIFVGLPLNYLARPVLGMAIAILDETVKVTVEGQGIAMIDAVTNAAGSVFLGIANIVIIFALLFIGIATILRVEAYGYKQLLARLILVALVVNFSFFIAKTIISVSNGLALEFLNSPTLGGSGIGVSFVDKLHLGTITAFSTPGGDGWGWLFFIGVIAIIFYLFLAFILLAAAVVLVTRLVILTFLVMLAPLAFVAMILPTTRQYANQWWQKLAYQSFIAPLYFLILIPAFVAMDSVGGIGGSLAGGLAAASGGNFAGGTVSTLVTIGILGGLMYGSLVVAKQLGAVGANMAIQAGNRFRKGVQGVIGRNTGGRLASMLANSGLMKTLETVPLTGGIASSVRRGLQRTAALRFGSDKSFTDITKRKEEQAREAVEHIGKTGTLIRRPFESKDDFEGRKKRREDAAAARQRDYVERREGETFLTTAGLGSTQARAAAVAAADAADIAERKRRTKTRLQEILEDLNLQGSHLEAGYTASGVPMSDDEKNTLRDIGARIAAGGGKLDEVVRLLDRLNEAADEADQEALANTEAGIRAIENDKSLSPTQQADKLVDPIKERNIIERRIETRRTTNQRVDRLRTEVRSENRSRDVRETTEAASKGTPGPVQTKRVETVDEATRESNE